MMMILRVVLALALLAVASLAEANGEYLGDYAPGATVRWAFATSNAAGARTDASGGWDAADLFCYKNGSTTERSSTAGYTITGGSGSAFDSKTGLTAVAIDLSDNTDSGFWAAGNEYWCILYADTETVDSQATLGVWMFSIGRNKDKLAHVVRDALKKGTTNYIGLIYIEDQRTGGPLTGLVFNSAGLTGYYARTDQGNAAGTSMTLATATLGTFTSSGFKEKDPTNMPGWYEFGVPNASVQAGAPKVVFHFQGAANMKPALYEVDLVDNTAQDTFNAITVTGITELTQADPPANPTLHQALMALYMALRNRTDTTSAKITYTDNAGTAIFKCTMADDGTTFTKSKCVAGP